MEKAPNACHYQRRSTLQNKSSTRMDLNNSNEGFVLVKNETISDDSIP